MRNISNTFEKLASVFLLLACFFTPFSTSLMGATAILACLCWLISGKFTNVPSLLATDRSAMIALLLTVLLVVGVFYSAAPLGESLDVLKKYRELIYLIMGMSLLAGKKDTSQLAENCFIAGCILLLLLSILMFFGVLPNAKYGHSTVYHITHSFFMAILAFWALQRSFQLGKYRKLWPLIFIAASVNLFYMVPGRTGMLVYVTLIILTIFQRIRLKYAIPAILLAVSMLIVTYNTSHNFSTRVQEAIHEIHDYNPEVSRTSLGMRFDWWRNSVELMLAKPLLGHGTGSFGIVQKKLVAGTKTKVSDNPHNEFLMLGVQVGFAGPILFLALLSTLFYNGIKTKKPEGFLLQGVTVAMATGCLMNSFLFDSHQGHFFALMAAVLAAPYLSTIVSGKKESMNN